MSKYQCHTARWLSTAATARRHSYTRRIISSPGRRPRASPPPYISSLAHGGGQPHCDHLPSNARAPTTCSFDVQFPFANEASVPLTRSTGTMQTLSVSLSTCVAQAQMHCVALRRRPPTTRPSIPPANDHRSRPTSAESERSPSTRHKQLLNSLRWTETIIFLLSTSLNYAILIPIKKLIFRYFCCFNIAYIWRIFNVIVVSFSWLNVEFPHVFVIIFAYFT